VLSAIKRAKSGQDGATGDLLQGSGGEPMSLPFDLAPLASELEKMPALLRSAARRLGDRAALAAPPGGGFCLLEHAWHLADLEREGFGVRLRRLLAEEHPFLPDFDGQRAARERLYRARPLGPGIEAFAAARADTLALLRSLPQAAWPRAGVQEGVGRVTLADVARAILEHDRAHAVEIAALGEAAGA
jgi:hypothetical protein